MFARYFRLHGVLPFLLGLALASPNSIAAPQTNSPPNAPFVFSPPDQGVNVPTDYVFDWGCTDPDGDPLVFDVYFGVAPDVQLVASNVNAFSYDPGLFANDTHYSWYIVARDSHGAETQGPVWTFTTRPENFIPSVPSNPLPPDNATVQPIAPTLTWESYDNDGETVLFDVYFGTSNPPALVASNVSTHSYGASGLSYDTQYYWKIVAHDPHGAESAGPVWTFRTRLSNYPPEVPSLPSPSNNATGTLIANLQRTLFWQSSDPDNDVLKYDIYFGTVSPPPLVKANHTSSSYLVTGLTFVTAYYWRIVVRDSKGVEVSGPEWTFTSEANDPPNAPSNPSPANNAVGQALSTILSWSASDPESWQALSYDLYLGTDPSPPLRATGLSQRSYYPGPLAMNTAFYWRIVTHDQFGLTTSGPVWKYTTLIELPPAVPSNPSPADGVQLSDTGTPVVLSWACSDPENKPLTYKIYFGVTPNPGFFATVTTKQYNLGVIGYNLLFYWYIVASDAYSSVTSPVWTFRSGPGNVPPNAPANPTPANNAVISATNPTLSWEGTDPNGDGLFYTLYFGTTSPPPLLASNVYPSTYSLTGLDADTDYYWRVVARDGAGLETSGSEWKFTIGTATGAGTIPLELTLGQCHPNPFNPQTIIPYAVPNGAAMHVRITIYDATGHLVRELVDETQSAGAREVIWRGDNEGGGRVSSGIYYCVLDAAGERRTRKLVLVK